MKVRIIADSDPTNPREGYELGTMACWHRKYSLGDVQPAEDPDDFLKNLAVDQCPRLGELIDYWYDEGYFDLADRFGWEEAHKICNSYVDSMVEFVIDRDFVVLPLYLYDHSGITMSCGPFSCPWDSGQVGWIYCSIDAARQNWIPEGTWDTVVQDHTSADLTVREYTDRILRGEVAVYSQYLEGDVYGYSIEYDEDEEGEDDSCWGFYGSDPFENGMSDSVPVELHEQLRNAEIEYQSY